MNVPLGTYFGAKPYPGSLNIVLDWPVALRTERALVWQPFKALFWPVVFKGVPCLMRRWAACPLHIAELISDRHLRTSCDVSDDDRVEVGIDPALIASVSIRARIAWTFLWMHRRSGVYDDDYLKTLANHGPRALALTFQDTSIQK